MRWRGSVLGTAAAVFIGCLLVYLGTLHPSVPGGDAGELIAVAERAEVAHPPGYPLYTVLAKLATLVPLRSVAWRVNALSALCDAGAAALVAATVVTASGSAAAGVLAGGLFAFSPVVWTYAVGAEVFPLNNLLVAALMWLALRWSREPRRFAGAIAIAAVVGLGLANHHTFVFYAVPTALWMLWHADAAIRTPARLAVLALTAGAGVAWYLYLPLAARHATTLSWGDPTTIGGFVDHVLRRDYGTFRLVPAAGQGAAGFVASLAAWGGHVLRATLMVGAVLAVVGATTALRNKSTTLRAWALLALASLLVYVGAFHALANLPVGDPLYRAVTARFWQQGDVVVCTFAGLGLAAVAERRRALAWLGAIVLVAAQLVGGLAAHDRHRDETVARYGRALLEPLPPDTLLLTHGDLVTNVTRYLQTCEGVRPDVVVLDQELMTKPWYVRRAAREHDAVVFPAAVYDPTAPDRGFTMRAFLDANLPRRPIAVYPEWKRGDPSVDGVYELWPMGLASRVAAVSAPPAIDDWQRESATALTTLATYGWRPLASEAPGTWERVALDDVWQAQHRTAWWLLTKALAPNADPRLLDAARLALERAERAHPDPPFYVHRNLGLVYERLAIRDPRWRAHQLRAWQSYLASAPPNDDARAAIAATVARLKGESVRP